MDKQKANKEGESKPELYTVLAAVPLDGDGQTLHEGDKVFTHGFTDNGWGRHYGLLYKNEEFPNVSEWWIDYDDGEQCAVLDFNDVFKV